MNALADAFYGSCLTPICGLYLWTWLMFGTLAVLAAGLYVTRDWPEERNG